MSHLSHNSKKSLTTLFSIITILLIVFFVVKTFKAKAQNNPDFEEIATSVTVGNSAPTFTGSVYEDPASTATNPTAIGAIITFRATATDANGENYYLIVCSSNSVTPGTGGGAPTCGDTKYCGTTSPTTSGSASSCSYTTKSTDAWSNPWYAFACDTNATSTCSPASQGTGSDGSESPFYVNHPPTFTSVSNNSPVNPGQSVTWTTQTTSDPDTGSTVKLLICKSNTTPTNGTCSGGASGTWCSSSAVASNPSCSYSVPNPNPDGSNNAYAFVVDNFNLSSSSKTSNFSVNNIAPVVSAVTFNGGNDINLAEGTTTPITVTATVTDNNGCSNGEIVNVYAYAYRSGIGYTGCDTTGEANNNHCYPQISCNVVSTGNTCSGPTDSSADYTCTINFQYYADSTTGTDGCITYPSENWLATVKAIDNNGANHHLQITTGVEMSTLVAFHISPKSIIYGTLNVGGKNDPLDKVLTTTATGNVAIDQEHEGIPNMCTNYDATTNPLCATVVGTQIPVGNQRYALTASTAYASGTPLTSSRTVVKIGVPKVTTGTPTSKSTWWGIQIPSNTLPGLYKGMNTIYAKATLDTNRCTPEPEGKPPPELP